METQDYYQLLVVQAEEAEQVPEPVVAKAFQEAEAEVPF